MKVSKDYVWEFLKDYGPPTLLSVLWAFYIVYQKPEGDYWEVFMKNFIPAFFGLNWIAMRFNRTRKTVAKKHKSEKMAKQIEMMQNKLDNIEKMLKDQQQKEDKK